MTNNEIKNASKLNMSGDHAYEMGFIAGANFVNERQPYTAEDMVNAFEWLESSGFRQIFISTWRSVYYEPVFSTNKLLKLWEEQE